MKELGGWIALSFFTGLISIAFVVAIFSSFVADSEQRGTGLMLVFGALIGPIVLVRLALKLAVASRSTNRRLNDTQPES